MKNFLVQLIAGMGLVGLLTQTVRADWVQTNGPSLASIQAFAVIDNNIFAGGSGIFLSTNNGTSWNAVNSGLTDSGAVWSLAVSSSGNVFAGTIGGGVFLSTNNGTNWTAVNSGLTNNSVQALAMSDSNIFAGTWGGVYLSINNGVSWAAVNSGLPKTIILSLAVSVGNIFAAPFFGGGIFRSTNKGISWKEVNSGDTINCFAVSGSNIFAGTSSGSVILSTNNGTSWTVIGLIGNPVFSLSVSGSNIFAGTVGAGIFLSTNNGTSWTAVNSGLTNTSVNALAVSGNTLLAGTQGAGVWRRPLSEMIPVIYNPKRVTLNQETLSIRSQNLTYPNVTIDFTLPHSDHVTVAIYNLSGHEIASLVNKNLSQGSHSITWNTRNVATGCYMVKMQAGGNVQVRTIPLFR